MTIEGRVHKLEQDALLLSSALSGDGTLVNLGIVGVLEEHGGLLKLHQGEISALVRSLDRFRWTILGWGVGAALTGSVVGSALVRALGGG